MYRNYGLTGKTVKVKKKVPGITVEEPWANAEVEMKIEAEYPNFLVAKIPPHQNPKGQGGSEPYRTTIHKNDIQTGEVILNGGEIR